MAKYYVFAVSISRMILEVGAEIDGIPETLIEVAVIVFILICVSVLICWCCCKGETRSTNDDITQQINESSYLINPQPVPRTSYQNSAENRAVVKKKVNTSISPAAHHPLQKHRRFLRNRMDVDFGLLDLLLGSGILSYEALHRVRSRSIFQERNDTLIDYITKHDCYKGLCQVLKDAHQSHIVNYLEADGVYNRKAFGDVWPLPERIVQSIDSNRHSLVNLIDPSELVIELYAKNVIGPRHREAITSKPTSYEQNETLLDIVRRTSMEDYSKAMTCFHTTMQDHIVQALTEGGKIVPVHANLDGADDVLETEKKLVDKITHLLRYQTTDYVDYILQQLQLRLIGVSVGHSVVCYFHCPEVDDLKRLQDKLRSRELERSLNTVFRNALPQKHIDRVVITSVDDQYADKTATGDSFQWSLERSISERVYTADDIETSELYSILERDFPVANRAWTSSKRASSKK